MRIAGEKQASDLPSGSYDSSTINSILRSPPPTLLNRQRNR